MPAATTPRKRKKTPRRKATTTRKRSARRTNRAKIVKSAETMAAVPIGERIEIDRTLIREEPPLSTADAVHEHFDLAGRYGVDLETFGAYAQSVRKVHAMGYADRLACALLSDRGPADREAPTDLVTHRLSQRVARLLAEAEDIGVADLARLVSAVASLRRAVSQAEKLRADRDESRPTNVVLDDKLREAVRALYGLPLPERDRRDTSQNEVSLGE